MSDRKQITLYTLWILSPIFLCLTSFAEVHADTLENALKEWDPYVIQGRIMELGKDYVVVSEKWVRMVDANVRGKTFRTGITDGRGVGRESGALRKGMLVLAMGGLAWDDKLKANVLMATEIQILDKQVNLADENLRKKLLDKARF